MTPASLGTSGTARARSGDRADAPRALVVRAAGTNCDEELARAFAVAGARVETIHLDRLIAEPEHLDGLGLLGLPGGFSYGDDIASGRIFAVKVRERLYTALRAAVDSGTLVIGACNGFQVLVQAGLLPGPERGQPASVSAPRPSLALVDNASARFVDDWCTMEVDPTSPCVWTKGLADYDDDQRMLPIAHGEGRLIGDTALIADLLASGRAPLRYAVDLNGSAERIAGVCDASGRVFGLMPHPERFLDWNRHPFFSRLDGIDTDPPGLCIFKAAVEAARSIAV